MNILLDSLQVIGSVGTAAAALVAFLTYKRNAVRNRNDIIRSYGTDVRRKIREFELQLQMWNDEFADSQHLVLALVGLEDALRQEGVPSPATPAFDEFIDRYGGSVCLEVWTKALQSTNVEHYRSSFLKAAYSFDGLLLIVHSASRILDSLTRQLYSVRILADVVNQFAVPQRRQMEADQRLQEGRDHVSHRDEVREFVNVIRAGFVSYQKRFKQVRLDVNRFFDKFFLEMTNLSDSDLYRLSHLQEGILQSVEESKQYTKEMAILLDAIKKIVAIDEGNRLVDIVASIEASSSGKVAGRAPAPSLGLPD